MRTITLITLAVIASTILSQGMVFQSEKCDSNSLNIGFLTSKLKDDIKVLENSVQVPKSHPCSSLYSHKGSCCDIESSAAYLTTLRSRTASVAQSYVDATALVIKHIYIPYMYGLGAQKLREKAKESPGLSFLAEFVDVVPISQFERIYQKWTKDFSRFANILLDFSAQSACLLCATTDVFTKYTVSKSYDATFGIDQETYRTAKITAGDSLVVANMFDNILREIRYIRSTTTNTPAEIRQKIENIVRYLSSSDNERFAEKNVDSFYPLALIDYNYDTRQQVWENISYFKVLVSASTSRTRLASERRRLLQGVQPTNFIDVVGQPARGSFGLTARNVTGVEGISLKYE